MHSVQRRRGSFSHPNEISELARLLWYLADLATIEGHGGADTRSLIWPIELQQQRFFRKQGIMTGVIGDFDTLKQMLTADRDLQGILIRAYQYVIARFDIDGFRIDTLRYLKGGLPQIFGNAMREFALSIGKENFFTFGEVLDGQAEDDIARFIGRNTNDAGDLVGVDAALDYPLFNTLKPVAKGFSAPPPSSGCTSAANRRNRTSSALTVMPPASS